MAKHEKATKPNYNYINPGMIQSQVDNIINQYCDKYGIDLYNYNQRVNIKHTEVNNILRYCYNSIFKPDKNLYNNQASLIDYDNIDQMSAVVDVFLNVCSLFNKALGLFSFGIFTGIAHSTLMVWVNTDDELNPRRSLLLKIKDFNASMIVDSLKDSGAVGLVSVANNDVETGLNWSANQAQQITNNTVYYLPSERTDKLHLEKLDG